MFNIWINLVVAENSLLFNYTLCYQFNSSNGENVCTMNEDLENISYVLFKKRSSHNLNFIKCTKKNNVFRSKIWVLTIR